MRENGGHIRGLLIFHHRIVQQFFFFVGQGYAGQRGQLLQYPFVACKRGVEVDKRLLNVHQVHQFIILHGALQRVLNTVDSIVHVPEIIRKERTGADKQRQEQAGVVTVAAAFQTVADKRFHDVLLEADRQADFRRDNQAKRAGSVEGVLLFSVLPRYAGDEHEQVFTVLEAGAFVFVKGGLDMFQGNMSLTAQLPAFLGRRIDGVDPVYGQVQAKVCAVGLRPRSGRITQQVRISVKQGVSVEHSVLSSMIFCLAYIRIRKQAFPFGKACFDCDPGKPGMRRVK